MLISPHLSCSSSPRLLVLQISGTAAALEQKSPPPDWLGETAEAYASTSGTNTSKTGTQAPSAAAVQDKTGEAA